MKKLLFPNKMRNQGSGERSEPWFLFLIIPLIFFSFFTANDVKAVTGVWQSCSVASTSCGYGWNYTMGYKFTPSINGQITHLCGFFSGTKTVRLFDNSSPSYVVLATASVTSSNSWSCSSITPVNVSAGSVYYVVADIASSGGCYQSVSLPATCGSVDVNAGVYQYSSGTFDSGHTEVINPIYGLADVVFSTSAPAECGSISSYCTDINKAAVDLSWNAFTQADVDAVRADCTLSSVTYAVEIIGLGTNSAGTATTYTWPGLTPDTAYQWRVTASYQCTTSYLSGSFSSGNSSFTTPVCQYLLSISKTGTGSGVVDSSPSGISCGSTCSASYISGASVTLTTSASPGSYFAGWSGDADCSDGTVTMNAPKGCTATFDLSDFTISTSPTSLRGPKVSGTSDLQTTITVNSLNNFNSGITLSARWCTSASDTVCTQSQPSGLTPSFSANPITPPVNSSINSTLSIDTNNPAVGSYYFRTRGVSGTLTHDTPVVTLTIIDLAVALTINPSSGVAPLNGVDLTATVSGSAVGTINYKFDCRNDGWDYIFDNISDNPKTVVDACNYTSAGTYTVKVRVERDVANPTEGTTQITVDLDTTPPTVSVTGAPADWQNTDAIATVACDDGGGGGGSPAYEIPQSAVASSEYSSSYLASNARDGNTATYWFSQSGSPPQWIYFNLGAKKDVSGIKVMIFSYDIPMIMDIQVSDDASSWTTVVSSWTASTGDTWIEKSFTEIAARYIRLYETAFARSYGQCTEFQALTKALGEGSGCDLSTYKLKTYASNPGACSTSYPDYTLISPQSISFYFWVCGAAKDIAGNAGFSSPVEFKVNTAPTAGICCQSCASPNCTTYTGQVFTLINDSKDPNGESDIIKSNWDIFSWGSDPDLSCSNICNYTPQTLILGAGTYTIELYVEDSQGKSDTATQPFTIKQSAIADFKCSLDNVNWKLCSSIKPNADEVVYFLDQSSPPQDGSITSYSWTFQNGSPATATGTNPSAKFQSAGSKQVTLTLGVTAGAPASETKTVFVQLPLPEWEEVAPF